MITVRLAILHAIQVTVKLLTRSYLNYVACVAFIDRKNVKGSKYVFLKMVKKG